jgi:ABC-type transport system involved in resistance to organic solvents, periplasmic component
MKISKEVQIALVAIVGIVVMFFGLKFLKGMTLFSTADSYYAKFSNVAGLSVSSPIYSNGFRVGVVEDVIYDYDGSNEIIAVLGLDNKMRLPNGTKAEISKDLMGNVELDLILGPNPVDQMEPGDTIYGQMQQGALAKAGEIIPQIQQMMPKIDSILYHVNMLLSNPALTNSLNNVDQITANLSSTTNELKYLSANLRTQMPGMMEKADNVLDNTNTLTKNLSDLDIAMTMAKVNNTLQNVEQMTAKLNSNEGTIGLLMRDQELYRNAASTMGHVDSLMIDLKQHPKRYVHFSIFGKKDK